MEIEKKYLIRQVPENLEQYDKWELEQCYLCEHPVIRVRRKDNEYILTYKNRPVCDGDTSAQALNIAEEVEVPLNEQAYLHLREKADGICIVKTRYRIPYGEYIIELDVFHDRYEGFCLAEVEFGSIEEGQNFIPPDWFGEDVSGKAEYTNSYMVLNG